MGLNGVPQPGRFSGLGGRKIGGGGKKGGCFGFVAVPVAALIAVLVGWLL